MIIITTMIIIIALKGTIRAFLQSPHCGMNHATHERLSCATCRITCNVVRRDSSAIKFDRVYIALILLAEPLTMDSMCLVTQL